MSSPESPAPGQPAGRPGSGEHAHAAEPDLAEDGGLSWSWNLDLSEILAPVGASQLGEAGDEAAAIEEAEMAHAADKAGTSRDLTAVIAEKLPAGPGLAAWLASADTGKLTDWDVPGLATEWRRVASWAQAGELSAVAEMVSRSAARDEHARVDPDGRPDQVTPSAASEVSLALVMSQQAAAWWADLGVTLRWRLPATGAALFAGQIYLSQARLIAEATSLLDEDVARRVEACCLPAAAGQTPGQLRAALRRAILKADPEGAEQRRKDAERQARVSLYPDPDTGTATLLGSRLPAVHAATAMARISALAWALKASGAAGGINLLRAQVFTGLLLGTLPLIPPPPGAPPDQPPDDGDGNPGGGASPDGSGSPDHGGGGPGRRPPDSGDGTRPSRSGRSRRPPQGPAPAPARPMGMATRARTSPYHDPTRPRPPLPGRTCPRHPIRGRRTTPAALTVR